MHLKSVVALALWSAVTQTGGKFLSKKRPESTHTPRPSLSTMSSHQTASKLMSTMLLLHQLLKKCSWDITALFLRKYHSCPVCVACCLILTRTHMHAQKSCSSCVNTNIVVTDCLFKFNTLCVLNTMHVQCFEPQGSPGLYEFPLLLLDFRGMCWN